MNKEQLIEAIKQRESEIAHYQINIDNYTVMIALLPQWPELLLSHRTADPVGFINDWSFKDIQLLSDLQFKDKLERTLLTERLEQRKATFVLKALQQKLEQA
jgi:hypothetical protein